jgi:hypothetical protein
MLHWYTVFLVVVFVTCNVYMSHACPLKRLSLYQNLKNHDNHKNNRNNSRHFNHRGKKRGNYGLDDEHLVKGTRDISSAASVVWGSILAMNSGYM